MSVNKVIIVGNVGKEPDVRTSNNVTFVSFNVATSDRWTDRNGQKQERTEWHSIKAAGKPAEFIRDYIHKGSLVFIEGKLKTDAVESNGVTRYFTSVEVQRIDKLSKDSDAQTAGSAARTQAAAPAPAPAAGYADEDDSEDLPF